MKKVIENLLFIVGCGAVGGVAGIAITNKMGATLMVVGCLSYLLYYRLAVFEK